MEVVPKVHRVPNVVGSNAVLLEGEALALVDTGIAGNGDTIVNYIELIGRKPSELKWVILSHYHQDHSGSAAELHERTGAQVVAHHAETERVPGGKLWLRKGNEADSNQPPAWYRWWRGGGARRSHPVIPETEVHQAVEEGEVLPVLGGLRIMHTPGHTPGSICVVLEAPRVLFVGDSVLNNIDRLSRPLMWDRSRRDELDQSLRRLREVEVDTCLFGHGPPLTDEVIDRVRALTARPYNMPTWMIVLKNWRTLRRFQQSTRRPGHWSGASG
ncbi:MAG: MBL fold metallo-hydrolase [Chloroflexi bacterium]|nr:MBL fold metallo-hydrolase [Chloroflexota bacterium]